MAEEKKSRASRAMGGSGKKSEKKSSSKSGKKKKVHKIHVSRLTSGGYLAQHETKPDMGEMPEEPEQHHLPDEDALRDHFAEHLPANGDNEAAEGEAPAATAQPSPMAAGMV